MIKKKVEPVVTEKKVEPIITNKVTVTSKKKSGFKTVTNTKPVKSANKPVNMCRFLDDCNNKHCPNNHSKGWSPECYYIKNGKSCDICCPTNKNLCKYPKCNNIHCESDHPEGWNPECYHMKTYNYCKYCEKK